MRASGKTTRKVDEAVQKLFVQRLIVIPFYSNLKDKQYYRGRDINTFIIDEDWESHSNVQKYLLQKILERLQLEHTNQYVVEGNKIYLK